MTLSHLLALVQVDLVAACSDDWCPDPEMARAELLVADGLIVAGVQPEQVANCLSQAAAWAWELPLVEQLRGMAVALADAGMLAGVRA